MVTGKAAGHQIKTAAILPTIKYPVVHDQNGKASPKKGNVDQTVVI